MQTFKYNDEYCLSLAKEVHKIIEDLYPINRSLTGDGVRETLDYISNIIPIDICEVPTGTKCFDWTVPNEWNLKLAELRGPDGEIIVSSKITNLSVVGYSHPINKKMSLDELLPHLHSDPDRPDVIPYRTSYYKDSWGFCIPHTQKQKLLPGEYSAVIDAKLEPGSLTYADTIIKGKREEEVLFSTYMCHPSMVNDNLSGVAFQTVLLRELLGKKLNFSYRGVFVPETLGAIVYLNDNGYELKKKTVAGLVVTCVADSAEQATYKKSRQGNSLIDRAVNCLADDIKIMDFWPIGSDERQYCSPGFDLPVGSLMRTRYYESPGYHSSADDMSIISISKLAQMIKLYMQIIDILEMNGTWVRVDGGFCEPRLGNKGLYSNFGGDPDNHVSIKKILWILNLADGKNDLISMAERSGYTAFEIANEILLLESKGLIKRI
jgi:aminopeptidase-like protein